MFVKMQKRETMAKPTHGGSLEPGTPSNPGSSLYDAGLLELIIRQRATSDDSRDEWEIGTSSGILRGRLVYYSVAPDGETTLTMFTKDGPPQAGESAVYIPLSQITYVKMFP